MKKKLLPILALLGLAAGSMAQTVSIDFGNDSTFRGVTSPGNWNSVAFGYFADLIDTEGNATTIDWAPAGFGGTDSFNSIIGATSNPPAAGEISAAQSALGSSLGSLAVGEAAIDFFRSDNGTTGVGRFQLQQVTAGQLYNLTFYGTKQYVTAGNEQTRYSVFDDALYSNLLGTGLLTTGTIDGTGNPDSILTLENLVGPSNVNNIFYIQWEGENDSTWGFINSMSVEAVPEPSTYALLALAGGAFAGYRLRRRARRGNSPRLMTAAVASAVLAIPAAVHAQVTTNAFDGAANYGGAGEPGWTNGANAGFGFAGWSLTNNPGTATNGSATTGISSNPGAVVQGMGTDAFRMWAYTTDATSVAQRSFLSPLGAGQTFSLQWGINWDSGNIGGNKGFVLLSGTNQLVNVNNGNSSAVTFNGTSVGFGFGNNAMTWSFTMDDATTLSVLANDRDGAGTFATNLAIGSQIDTLRLYVSRQQDSSINRYQYFDDLQITTVPEPSTWALVAAGTAAVTLARLRLNRRG